MKRDVGIVTLLLTLAIIAAFLISTSIAPSLDQEVATLVAILFAGLDIGGIILIAGRNWHR